MIALAIVRQLRFRLLAGVILALVANSAAAQSTKNRNVEKFKAQTSKQKRATHYGSGNNVSWFTTDLVDEEPVRPSPLQPPAPLQPAPPKPAFQTLPVSPGGITVPIAELDDVTTGTYQQPKCKECEEKAKNSLSENAGEFKQIADAIDKSTDNQSRKDKLSDAAVHQAFKKRKVADFCGGGMRQGNRSKCMCAAGVKDALLQSGLCNRRPDGHSVNLAGLPVGRAWQQNKYTSDPKSSLMTACPAFRQTKGRSRSATESERAAWDAPVGSVIIYSTTRHVWGHSETVVQATATNIDQVRRYMGKNIKIGQKLWCSDFCRAAPTLSNATNFVEGIYSL